LLRGFLLAAAAALAVVGGIAVLAFNPNFQTWAARRVLARRPALAASVDSVSFGLNDVELRNVRVERRGAVLELPSLEAEMPVLPAGFAHTVLIRRLVAKGWTLDLRGFNGGNLELAAVAVPMAVFQGVLNQLRLPVDFALDGLDVEGDVILPAGPGRAGGRAHVMLSGGGLAAGGEGRFGFNLKFVPTAADAPVNSLIGDGTLFAAMDSPRTFSRVALRVDSAATGPKLPRTMRLATDVSAARGPTGEIYAFTLAGESKQLVSLQASFPGDRRRLAGTWKLDVSDDDLTPFMLGRALPVFYGNGAGRFDADAGLAEIHVRGGLDLTADRLGVFRPQFADVGPVRLTAEFDLTRGGNTFRVDRLQAALAGTGPILTVTGLQPFAFNARTGELTVADSARDLFSVAFQDVPLGWGQPLLRGIVLTGGSLRGSLVAGARDGGLSLRSNTPLTVVNLSATREGRPLLQNAGMSLAAAANYTPLGWQVEIKSLGAATPPAYRLEARLGRLADPGQPVKLTGRLSVNLPVALAQPALTGGNLVCDFAASLAAKRAIEVKLAVSDLALEDGAENLPEITADVRADIDAAGKIVFAAPFLISQDGRQSDLMIAGTMMTTPAGLAVDGQITGGKISPGDTRILAALFLLKAIGAGPTHAPFLGSVSGRLALALKAIAAPQFVATDVTGTLLFGAGAVKLDELHASLGDTGEATISGACVFDGAAGEPYSLNADVTVGNFDPAPIFRTRYPGRMPTVEGKFNIAGQVSGRGRNPYDAVMHTRGDLRFVSNGGVLRVLSTDIASKGGAARKVAIIGSLIGDLTSAVTGRKDLGQAITEVAGRISTIPYDQMSLVISRDSSLNTTLRDFALISPEMRLEGGGEVTYEADTPLLEQPLAAQFKLGARGHTADLFKAVGMLGAKADDLGYFEFLEPLKIGGTLGDPDTSELQAALLKDIYNRSGASDLFDKLLGK